MQIRSDLVGQKFGRLTVIAFSHLSKHHKSCYLCKCDCGNNYIVIGSDLSSGRTRSCGYLQRESSIKRATIHGLCKQVPEYEVWKSMTKRCRNIKNKDYHRYGGRGIKVCDRWMDFTNFYSDMGRRPSLKHSLDRINNGGDYYPENCRWITHKEQMNNTSRNHLLNAFGEIKAVGMWAEDNRCAIGYRTLLARINRGWDTEYAITARLNSYKNKP